MACEYIYDLAFSYSSQDQVFVERVYRIVSQYIPSVFYAPVRQAEVAGGDMYGEFFDIYRHQSLFVAAFVSKDYVASPIPMHEASSALTRLDEENRNCFIPIYLDGTKLPGLSKDILYVSAQSKSEAALADLLRRKVQKDPLYCKKYEKTEAAAAPGADVSAGERFVNYGGIQTNIGSAKNVIQHFTKKGED